MSGQRPWIMLDVESDGPIPGDYSMIAFGAVVVEKEPARSFGARLAPISGEWIPEALAVSGFSREEVLEFSDPKETMESFREWLDSIAITFGDNRPMFISDNNGYDWSFINWYFHHFLGNNPFGHSSTNLGGLYKGMVKNMRKNFKHLRKTRHTHDPVDDAKGNVEAMLEMINRGLRL